MYSVYAGNKGPLLTRDKEKTGPPSVFDGLPFPRLRPCLTRCSAPKIEWTGLRILVFEQCKVCQCPCSLFLFTSLCVIDMAYLGESWAHSKTASTGPAHMRSSDTNLTALSRHSNSYRKSW